MHYINPARIAYDIPERVLYIQSFINFDPSKDGALIRSCQPFFSNDVLNNLNTKMLDNMLRFDTTCKPFTVEGQTGRHGCRVEDLHREHPNIKYVRFLQKLLGAIIANDDWSPTSPYWKYMDTVGRMHIGVTDIELPSRKQRPPLQVHIREIALLIAWIDEAVVDVIMKGEGMELETKVAAIKAFTKYWWIQNDLFAKHQTVASLEKLAKEEQKSSDEEFVKLQWYLVLGVVALVLATVPYIAMKSG